MRGRNEQWVTGDKHGVFDVAVFPDQHTEPHNTLDTRLFGEGRIDGFDIMEEIFLLDPSSHADSRHRARRRRLRWSGDGIAWGVESFKRGGPFGLAGVERLGAMEQDLGIFAARFCFLP